MADETKVAVSETASKNSEKKDTTSKEAVVIVNKEEKTKGGGGKTTKKLNYQNPFSYTDPIQAKIVNCLMKRGKKTVAQRIIKDTFDELFRLGEKDPLKAFEIALKNATPTVEVKAKRVGGSVYQIPIDVSTKRQQSLSVRWILQGARSRKGRPMYKRLAQELLDASQDTGIAVNKKKEAHKMARANKAFAHLARY